MKVPEPRKLKSGTWFCQLRLGGESIPVSAGSAKECKAQAAVIKAEYLAGKRPAAPSAAADLTLKDCIGNYITRFKKTLSPSTVCGYETLKRTRFRKYMDRAIRRIDFQQMVNDEIGVASEKTVQNAWGLAASAMRDAGISVPSVKLPKVPVKEIPFLQPEEIKPFCRAVAGTKTEIPALLELHGLRCSEALALEWKDVDLKRGLIHIRGAVVRNSEGRLVKKETNKNRSSTRTIPIMIPQLKDALNRVDIKTERVVTIAGNTINAGIRRACESAGITVVTNHGLRHSFASLGYHLGISERQLMQMGGGSDYHTMHKIYIRVAQRDRERAKNKMTEFYTPPPTDPDSLRMQLREDLAVLVGKYAALPGLKQALIDEIQALPEENANKNANESEKSA